MSLAIATNNENTSPFDSIRRTDEQGEYWLARDLMTVMGYPRWVKFESPILQAIENIELTGDKVSDHFLPLMVKTQGRNGRDYRLSRYACYMIALSCDGRKLEVASAKKYFAIKTREAEVIIPAQSQAMAEMDKQIEILKLQNENLNATLQLRHLDNNMLSMHGAELVLTLRGKADQLVRVEQTVTEVVNPKTQSSERILTAEQLKKIIKQNTGQTIPSMKWFTDKLREKGRDDLLVPVTRHQISEYVTPETLSEAISLVFGKNRQLLLGE
jgi:DNA-damage-inducible protein D